LNTVAHGYALSIPVNHGDPILTHAVNALVKKENLLTAGFAWDNPCVNQTGQKRREMSHRIIEVRMSYTPTALYLEHLSPIRKLNRDSYSFDSR
jgi:hypothetical protein